MDDPLEVSGQEPQLCELEKPVELGRNVRSTSQPCLCPGLIWVNKESPPDITTQHFRPRTSSQSSLSAGTQARWDRECSHGPKQSLQPAKSAPAWPEFEPKWGNPCAPPHCFTVFPLTSSLSSFMASHVLLKASEEEMKGRLLSRLCAHMSPDELFSPGCAHKGLQLMLHGTLKKE